MVDFNLHIRPILSDRCYACHGPDGKARQADLRLDTKEGLLGSLEGGRRVVVPGRSEMSELYRRVTTSDPNERMPPSDSDRVLSTSEIERIKAWIEKGAPYDTHWAFQPVVPLEPPRVSASGSSSTLDLFILERPEEQGLAPSPPANRRQLMRRVTLDLTGLPPTPAEIRAFVADPRETSVAYEKVVDRLLESPRFGEHFAYRWLDAARYADSDGYESDPIRTMWPWRDWVVNALNDNMPYDQFILEQLAGDLFGEPTLEQRLATGFNRNHRLNNEGGILPEEWLVEYVADRTETTATVFMGLTWGCARCHDHKYDPVTQVDYYRLFAFFHNVPEKGVANGGRDAEPMLEVPRQGYAQEYKANAERLDRLRNELKTAADSSEATTRLKERIGALEARQRKTGARVMIMAEMDEPRATHVLARGAYNRPGERVSAGTPSWLLPMDPALPRNRLGLARWLTDPAHPLTARVAVNRFWEHYFGVGLVKTQEDFGSQGESPSHRRLLDYLALEFVRSGWDVKQLQKEIVMSSTYRQSSRLPEELARRDPDNRLFARGPRQRLAAAVIRDQALAASGLLVGEMGGAPVKPYQPDGLWREIIKGGKTYTRDTGASLYRRSLYTFWRRAVKPPLMMLLDANERDTCAVGQERTNTPLQALLLLNEVTFVEAARALAARMLREGGEKPAERISLGLELLTARRPTAEELSILADELDAYEGFYTARPEEAGKLVGVGESPRDTGLAVAELAAYTALARVLLNLDETITKG